MFISFKDAKVKVVNVESTFERGYTDEYLSSLLEQKYVGKHLFNGDCLRLEGIDISFKEVILKVSKTDYYSLLATNLSNKGFLTDYDVIGNSTLSNNLAVSVLIRDVKDELLLVERSSKVAVGSSMLCLKKLQPIILCDVKLDYSFDSLVLKPNEEIKNIHITSKDCLVNYFSDYNMSEATMFHLKK